MGQEFGLEVRKLREKQNLSIRQLASLVRVSHSHLAYIERGQRGASQKTVAKLADFFGDPLFDFLNE